MSLDPLLWNGGLGTRLCVPSVYKTSWDLPDLERTLESGGPLIPSLMPSPPVPLQRG